MIDWNFLGGGGFLPIEGEEDTHGKLLRAIPARLDLFRPLEQAVVHHHLSSNVFRPSHVLVPSAARGSRSATLFLSGEICQDQAGRNTSLTTRRPLVHTVCSRRGDPDVSSSRFREPRGCHTPTPEMVRPGAGEEIGDSELHPWRASLMSSPFQTAHA